MFARWMSRNRPSEGRLHPGNRSRNSPTWTLSSCLLGGTVGGRTRFETRPTPEDRQDRPGKLGDVDPALAKHGSLPGSPIMLIRGWASRRLLGGRICLLYFSESAYNAALSRHGGCSMLALLLVSSLTVGDYEGGPSIVAEDDHSHHPASPPIRPPLDWDD
jgi:hypothetical protein